MIKFPKEKAFFSVLYPALHLVRDSVVDVATGFNRSGIGSLNERVDLRRKLICKKIMPLPLISGSC